MTSTTKPVTYHIDTPGIRKLEQAVGAKLTGLTQREKYQLIEAIGGYLSNMVADDENTELGEGDVWTLIDYAKQCCPDIENNVFAILFILKDDECETLAHLLPAVAEYARDDQ
jgi:hypothetical protein